MKVGFVFIIKEKNNSSGILTKEGNISHSRELTPGYKITSVLTPVLSPSLPRAEMGTDSWSKQAILWNKDLETLQIWLKSKLVLLFKKNFFLIYQKACFSDMLVPPENYPNTPLSVTCSSWPANSYFQTCVYKYMCVFETKAPGLRCLLLLSWAFHLLTDQCPPLQKGGQGTETPWGGSEGVTAPNCQYSMAPLPPLTPTQKEILISNQTPPLKFGSRWPERFFCLRKNTHFICTPIYIIFLFLHLNIKILLCFVL